VFVEPNTNYTLSAWIRTSANNNDGYFGVRGPNNGPIINETRFYSLPNYTKLTVQFNSGNRHSVEVFAGMWALSGDTWIQVDDFSLTKD